MKRPKITILTDPVPWGYEFLNEGGRRIARLIRDAFRPSRKFFNQRLYRGHFAVTRSLIEGLQQINASFNYNPYSPWSLADTVIVLAGVRTLRQAIRLKQQGRIKKLFAGPNIMINSSDYNSLLASPEVDAAITPCQGVIDNYLQDVPALKDRIFVWPAGVDTHYWKPNQDVKRDSILIFEKQNKGPVGPVEPYVNYLQGLGWTVQVIQYGSYTHDQYLHMLQRSCLMLGFVVSESQGLAWAEAWSCDVPTLILNITSNISQGRLYDSSTAPYLCSQNGLFFDDLEDFKKQFSFWETHREQFTPRAWTCLNMSDEVCASMIYKKITHFST